MAPRVIGMLEFHVALQLKNKSFPNQVLIGLPANHVEGHALLQTDEQYQNQIKPLAVDPYSRFRISVYLGGALVLG